MIRYRSIMRCFQMDPLNEKSLVNLVNDISLKFFGKPFTDKVVFNHRLRTTGGRYLPSERLIELNPKYAVETETGEFIGIIKHELCHYHLHIDGKGYKHGDADFKKLLKRPDLQGIANLCLHKQICISTYIDVKTVTMNIRESVE